MDNFSRIQNKKTKKKWIIVGIAVVAVALIIGGVIVYNNWQEKQRQQLIDETVATYIEAVESQDYAQITNLASKESLEEIDYTTEEAQERYTAIYTGIGVADVTAENIQVTEDEETNEINLKYDLHMTTSLGKLTSQSYETTLREAEDDFAIDWHTNLIFPEMEPGDTVRILFESGDRGNIYDRNGELLAGKVDVWQAGLYPAALGEGDDRANNLEAIADEFETSTDQLENLLAAEWVIEESFVPVTIVEEGQTPELTGVLYQETTVRGYPLGEAGAHLVGYTGEVFAEDIEADPTLQPGDDIGKSGLEYTFDKRLRGNKGGSIRILNSDEEEKSILQEAPVENGENITLTINASLQEEYFNGFNGESGAAVVTEPTSGELLVLTSSPSFDPTLMARGISTEAYQAYTENEESPFLPRYTARYAPGSTFKAITGAIGLDEGVTTLEKSHTITGYEWKKDESWGDFGITRVNDEPTEVNLADALIYSDNIFFAREALEMGAETYLNGLKKFPFEETLELPLNMEPAQISNSGSFDHERLLADTAYGQGELLMSPIHQAVFYGAVANSGQLVYPQLELEEEPAEITQPISQKSAETMSGLLTDVVESSVSSTYALNESARTLAAKTGTTEFQSSVDENSNEIDGFLLAYDAEEQSFLTVILVEGGWGSDVVDQFSSILTSQ